LTSRLTAAILAHIALAFTSLACIRSVPAAVLPSCGSPLASYASPSKPSVSVTAYSNGFDNATAADCVVPDVPGTYGDLYQCVEFVKRFYSQALNAPSQGWKGSAVDYYSTAAVKGLLAFPNGGATPPAPDDIIVYSGETYGHVAIVTGVETVVPGSMYTLLLIEQNNSYPLPARVPLTNNGGHWSLQGRGPHLGLTPIGWLRLPPSGPTTRAFEFTGAEQQWVVPAGVTSIDVDVRGAQGGGAPAGDPNTSGGLGGRVQTTLTVTPGETLYIYVGGKGGDLVSPNTAGPGGFNGGGPGAIDNVDQNAPSGGGGGASDIRRGGNTPDKRIVAAGGGGGAECCQDGKGGDGGGTTGSTGGSCSSNECSCAEPGGGGTQFLGGVGGGGCNGSGSSGSLDQGGAGGNGNRAGGGGGGGYYGGGGGGGCCLGAGGGGGSSYPPAASHTTGFQAGNGSVSITYTAN
jgi:hypothetical protein